MLSPSSSHRAETPGPEGERQNVCAAIATGARESAQELFARVRPHCAVLLAKRSNPQEMKATLAGVWGRREMRWWGPWGRGIKCRLRSSVLVWFRSVRGQRLMAGDEVSPPGDAWDQWGRTGSSCLVTAFRFHRSVGLLSTLQTSGGEALAECAEYVMFPLLLILDAVAAAGHSDVASRSGTQAAPAGTDEDGQHTESGASLATLLPAAKSFGVAEAVLACVLAVIDHVGALLSDAQRLTLLHHLSQCLSLDVASSSEEVRHAGAWPLFGT